MNIVIRPITIVFEGVGCCCDYVELDRVVGSSDPNEGKKTYPQGRKWWETGTRVKSKK